MSEFKELLGKTLTNVEKIGEDRLEFTTKDNKKYVMYHSQDCCESVRIEDICGDLKDLIGNKIIQAEESTNNQHPEDFVRKDAYYEDSFTWTFYRIATKKGQVVIRWLGESNGYYSESVDFEKCF